MQEFHLIVTATTHNAVDMLVESAKLSRHDIKQAMQKGCVWHTRNKHTQRLRRSKKSLQIADEIHMYYNPKILEQTVLPAILLKDEGDYSIWYKPYGMLCQGSKWSDHTTINRFVETNLTPQRSAFLVHRLDRATTGVIAIAHSKSMARILSHAFETRQTEKHYHAIVAGKFEYHEHDQSELTINTEIDEKPATSHVRLLSYDKELDRSLLEIKIDTGRKHQIRKHLASIKLPIIGDRMHGIVEENCSEDLQLCAVSLSLPNEVNGNLKTYRLPEKFRLQLQK